MDKKEYWKPSVTTDVIVADIHQAKYRESGAFVNIVLIKRDEKSEAYPGCWAFPGGFLEEGESLEDCAVRELKEETGIVAQNLMPMGVYSKPDRDPRSQVISNAFLTIVPTTDEQPLKVIAGDDAIEYGVFNLKGTFDRKDGSLTVRLRNVEKSIVISFKASFTKGDLSLLNTNVEYTSEHKLAFDHAEMLARTILRVPDLVMPSTERDNISNGETGKE